MRILATMLLAACNHAPVEWDDYGRAGGAISEWGGPSEICSEELIALGDLYVDGYWLCLTRNELVPIDDPVFVPCDETAVDPDGSAVLDREDVFYVYDGERARAYPIEWMKRREAIHDVMGRVPVLVDW